MQPGDVLNIVLKANTEKDKTKNTPTSNEIAVLMVNNDQFELNKRDVIVYRKNDEKDYPHKFINENLSMYDPLAYPLLHLFGEPGWQFQTYPKTRKFSNTANSEIEIIKDQTSNSDIQTVQKLKYVSAREFYAYRLQDRLGITI